MKNRIVKFVVLVCCLCSMPGIVRAQLSVHQFDQLMKKIDDVLWYEKVGDIAHVDKVILCGPPRWKEFNPTSMSAGNELKFRAYIFIPKSVDENKKYPLIVFPHSGVHADMDTYYAHIIRELIALLYSPFPRPCLTFIKFLSEHFPTVHRTDQHDKKDRKIYVFLH